MAEPEVIVSDTDVVDWGLKVVGVEDAWRLTKGEGVRVGVIDTGWPNHPDLPNVVGRYGWEDAMGHGTHTAGIIGAVDNGVGIIGVAPHCSLLCAGAIPATQESDIVSAIQWCVENGAQIINMSFGSPNDVPSVHAALMHAYEAGVVLVASAGNSFVPGVDTISYPARYPQVLAVAALGKDMHKAVFSSAGEELRNSVSMPGVDMLSCWLGGQYARMSGTSCAAPMLSGLLALLLAHEQPDRVHVHDFVQDTLHRIAKKIDDFNFTGIGMPNAAEI